MQTNLKSPDFNPTIIQSIMNKYEAEVVKWFRKAAEQGYEGARTILKAVENGKIIRHEDSGE